MKRIIKIIVALIFMSSNLCQAQTEYQPSFWQFGGNLQTILPYLFPNQPEQKYIRERWELEDGDFVDADWTELPVISMESIEQKPVIVLFHGLEGSSQSHYARDLMAEAKIRGWIGVVVHFRGCSGEPNRLPRVYYAGDSKEISNLIKIVRAKAPNNDLYAAGVSLGGNALLKWLGEYPEEAVAQIKAAVSISAPIALKETAHQLDRGLNYWLYSKNFVATMKPKALAMAKRFPEKLNVDRISNAETVQDMDNAVTAILFGAENADHYYDLNAAKPWISTIKTQTMIINAQNDPFVPFEMLPKVNEVPDSVTLNYPKHGGHAGFSSNTSNSKSSWLSNEVFTFFNNDDPIFSSDSLVQFSLAKHHKLIFY